MGRPVAVARSLTRQVGRCSSNRLSRRRPLASASTRYSGFSPTAAPAAEAVAGAAVGAAVGGAAAGGALAPALCRRAMDHLLDDSNRRSRVGASLDAPERPAWTRPGRLHYRTHHWIVAFIIRECKRWTCGT